jgi:hypothetical protein
MEIILRQMLAQLVIVQEHVDLVENDVKRYGPNTKRQQSFDAIRHELIDLIEGVKDCLPSMQTAEDDNDSGVNFSMKFPLMEIVDDEPDKGGAQ